jgi:transcriptional regulator with PAS, ATPase and Fis domain
LKSSDKIKSDGTASTLEEAEYRLIKEALERNGGNYSAAADQLGITRQTLYNKLKKTTK